MKETLKSKIKELMPDVTFCMQDFWAACPYSQEFFHENKCRKHEIGVWRHIGRTWAVMSGMTTTESIQVAGNGNHTTTIHSMKSVIIHLEGNRIPRFQEALDAVVKHSLGYAYSESDDPHINELMCLVRMEHY